MTKTAPIAFTNALFPSPLVPRILLEDTHLVVLSKPAGLLSQGEIKGDANLVDWLRSHFGRHYVGLIHRLDRNTSGVMVVAKRTKSARRLTEALQNGQLERSYLGWVIGTLSQEKKWSHSLLKDEKTNRVSVVSAVPSKLSHSPSGKIARLTARPIQHHPWQGHPLTLVEFILETGRSHQIRVQAAYEGFPLLGDTKYASPFFKSPKEQGIPKFSRVALHSARLRFPHPMSGEILTFEDPLPTDLDLPLREAP